MVPCSKCGRNILAGQRVHARLPTMAFLKDAEYETLIELIYTCSECHQMEEAVRTVNAISNQ